MPSAMRNRKFRCVVVGGQFHGDVGTPRIPCPTTPRCSREQQQSDQAQTALQAGRRARYADRSRRRRVKAVSEALNGLLADSFALYLKTKNFHWHVSGPHFRDYHLLLDEQAADILGATDDMAERVRKIGGTTLRSIGHIAKLQTHRGQRRGFRAAGRYAARADERQQEGRRGHAQGPRGLPTTTTTSATASLIEIWLDQTEKRTWFLFEAARGASNDGH